ncbi:hypothetical protein ACOME3_007030 [Neoechinorhynchus agilis]
MGSKSSKKAAQTQPQVVPPPAYQQVLLPPTYPQPGLPPSYIQPQQRPIFQPTGQGIAPRAQGIPQSSPVRPQSGPVVLRPSYIPELGAGSPLITVGWPGITCPPFPTYHECQKIATLTGLPVETVQSLSKEFQRLSEGNGYMDVSKFQAMFLASICGPSAISANTLATNLFHTFDTNRSGKLDFPEFVMAFKTLQIETQALKGLSATR